MPGWHSLAAEFRSLCVLSVAGAPRPRHGRGRHGMAWDANTHRHGMAWDANAHRHGMGWESGARWPVSRVLSRMAIHLGRPLPGASRDRPGRRRGNPPVAAKATAAPTWSCSRWGLPCRPPSPGTRCALTAPFHPCPAARGRRGGLLSVALSLGSPPPDVIRHRVSVEPGLSSPRPRTRGGHPAIWRHPESRRRRGTGSRGAHSAAAAPTSRATASITRTVSSSRWPSTQAGRQWRWKAAMAARVRSHRRPWRGTP